MNARTTTARPRTSIAETRNPFRRWVSQPPSRISRGWTTKPRRRSKRRWPIRADPSRTGRGSLRREHSIDQRLVVVEEPTLRQLGVDDAVRQQSHELGRFAIDDPSFANPCRRVIVVLQHVDDFDGTRCVFSWTVSRAVSAASLP